MSIKNEESKLSGLYELILAIIAILALKKFFEDENTKIISNEGAKALENQDAMKQLDDLILKNAESESTFNNIVLDL